MHGLEANCVFSRAQPLLSHLRKIASQNSAEESSDFLALFLAEDTVTFCAQSPRLSPQTFYLITVEGGIPANYCTFLSDTLGYEEAIEGISMMEWQRSNMREVFKENR
jgi:hypothetical protein